MKRPGQRIFERILLSALLLLLLVRLGLLLARSGQTLALPFQLDPTEGIVFSECAMLGRGVNIYARFSPERFISAPYPPAYYIITALLMRLTGVNLLAGRLVSLLATWATAGAIVYALRPQRRAWQWPLLAGLLWVGTAPTFVWAARLKPDLLAVAGSLAGVAWTQRHQGSKAQLWAVLPLTVAVWSKQSALAGVVAVGLALLLQDRRAALRFGLLYAAVAGLPLLLADFLLDHGLWEHLVTFHVLPWSAGRFLGHLWDVVSAHPLLFAAGLGLLAWELTRRKRPSLLSLYILLALVFSFSGGTFGGYHNHYLEALAAACLLTGAALQSVPAGGWRLAALALLLLQVGAFWWVPAWLRYEFHSPVFEQAGRLEGLAQYVRDHGGPEREFFSDNVALLVCNGQEVRFNDPLIMAQAALLGLWDESEFLRTIEQGGFEAILWRDDLAEMGQRSNDLSPAAFAAIRRHYRILYRDVENVYVPR
ncbi:MAG: hypothetical protein JXA37_14275 [Chloroflexia bacterium]|nr:hypothetical protein [Chloroflexia bacterium]